MTAISGNTLTVPSATWTTSAGVTSFVSGAATIALGAGTVVILPDQAGAQSNSIAQVSVGSTIDAFGTATEGTSGSVALDAPAGRVRLENTVASGLVTVQGSGSLTVDLSTLGGRAVFPLSGSGAGPFDFSGTGGPSGVASNPAQYQVLTSGLDLSNAIVGAPVELTGLTVNYGAAQPDFTATLLQDTTTIGAELVLDWGSAGSAMPFASITSTELDLLDTGMVPGLPHQVAVGAQIVDRRRWALTC